MASMEIDSPPLVEYLYPMSFKPVRQNNRGFGSQVPVNVIDQSPQRALVHYLINGVEGNFRPPFHHLKQMSPGTVGNDGGDALLPAG
jgi:hypothetical protein